MEPDAAITILEARIEDLDEILLVQHRAFCRVAREYRLPAEEFPPIREDHLELQRLADEGWRFLKAVDSRGAIVGSVRAAAIATDPTSIEVGRLVVDDGWERHGVGSQLMRVIVALFPQADRVELFTGAEAVAPLELYRKLGYTPFRTEVVASGIELVWLEKALRNESSVGDPDHIKPHNSHADR